MKDCKHYCKDYQLEGVCKKFSDWSEAMPTVVYCAMGPCGAYEIDFDCKWHKDDFCVNADSPCVADWCPCTQYPDLCKYYEGSQSEIPTYNELYEYWLKTKDKPNRKRKNDQLPGQTDMFDIIDND